MYYFDYEMLVGFVVLVVESSLKGKIFDYLFY